MTSIKRNILTIKQNTSEVGLAMDFSARRYNMKGTNTKCWGPSMSYLAKSIRPSISPHCLVMASS